MDNKGINLEFATNNIWSNQDRPGYIGLRLDCGDAGVIYFTPEQARSLVVNFNAQIKTFDDFDNQEEG